MKRKADLLPSCFFLFSKKAKRRQQENTGERRAAEKPEGPRPFGFFFPPPAKPSVSSHHPALLRFYIHFTASIWQILQTLSKLTPVAPFYRYSIFLLRPDERGNISTVCIRNDICIHNSRHVSDTKECMHYKRIVNRAAGFPRCLLPPVRH